MENDFDEVVSGEEEEEEEKREGKLCLCYFI